MHPTRLRSFLYSIFLREQYIYTYSYFEFMRCQTRHTTYLLAHSSLSLVVSEQRISKAPENTERVNDRKVVMIIVKLSSHRHEQQEGKRNQSMKTPSQSLLGS